MVLLVSIFEVFVAILVLLVSIFEVFVAILVLLVSIFEVFVAILVLLVISIIRSVCSDALIDAMPLICKSD
ncbi:MAG: hypothetical protein CM15mP39_08060 [Synechococcus sp.]|nr:MAG: hypothetical protein CM15mP39_08060 [Synechococcus sp.]